MSQARPAAEFPPLIVFGDPSGPGETYRPPAERILSGDPLQTSWTLYASADGRFNAGVWECQPGKWRVVFTESEYCQILCGHLVINGDDGSVRTCRAGDVFLSPSGFTGTWDVRELTRKYFVNYE